MPAHALARNPHLPAAKMVHDCAAEGSSEVLPMFQISPPEPWRVVRTKRYHDEGTKMPTSELVVTGVFTSGTGAGDLPRGRLPEKYRGQEFVGNVAGNLVHRRGLTSKGATFTATRLDEKVEFLASTDTGRPGQHAQRAGRNAARSRHVPRGGGAPVVESRTTSSRTSTSTAAAIAGASGGSLRRVQGPDPPRLGKATTAELVATLGEPEFVVARNGSGCSPSLGLRPR